MKVETYCDVIQRGLDTHEGDLRVEDAEEALKLFERSILQTLQILARMNQTVVGQEGVAYLYGEDELRAMAEEAVRIWTEDRTSGWPEVSDSCEGQPESVRGFGCPSGRHTFGGAGCVAPGIT